MDTSHLRKPLEENQVVVHVPKGTGQNVKVVEVDPNNLPNEITVQISKKRRPTTVPVLGVIIK